jgi:hypothetical protein
MLIDPPNADRHEPIAAVAVGILASAGNRLWGFLYKPSKRGILEINETGLGLAAERWQRDRSSQKTSETHSDHTN